MMANYSKGEWIPYQRKSNNVSICVKSNDKEVVVIEVASLNTLLGYDTIVANACLISAAPDMYEALKELVIHGCTSTKAEKALAKADGRNV